MSGRFSKKKVRIILTGSHTHNLTHNFRGLSQQLLRFFTTKKRNPQIRSHNLERVQSENGERWLLRGGGGPPSAVSHPLGIMRKNPHTGLGVISQALNDTNGKRRPTAVQLGAPTYSNNDSLSVV
jgi:hypothetical protein